MALLPADAPLLYESPSANCIPCAVFSGEPTSNAREPNSSQPGFMVREVQAMRGAFGVVRLSICLLPVRGLLAEPDKAYGRGLDTLGKNGQS